MPNDAIPPYQEDPDHMIIWLSLDIGDPHRHQHLKRAFATNIDPACAAPVKLNDRNIDILFGEEYHLPVNFEGVRSLLAAFTSVERCVECFEQNQHKRIIFITSGSIGQTAVPIILERFKHTFTDPVTDEPYDSIYVYCHNIEYQMHWALDYREYIQIFNYDADLLVRMIRDIANYFVMIGKRLLEEDPPNNAAAYYRFNWAHELYQRYSKMENVSLKKEFGELNQLRDNVEEKLKQSSDEDDST
jgi:hypothetical protein